MSYSRRAGRALGLVSVVVRDYDEALGFYIGKLGFELVEDTPVPAQGKRWVVVMVPTWLHWSSTRAGSYLLHVGLVPEVVMLVTRRTPMEPGRRLPRRIFSCAPTRAGRLANRPR